MESLPLAANESRWVMGYSTADISELLTDELTKRLPRDVALECDLHHQTGDFVFRAHITGLSAPVACYRLDRLEMEHRGLFVFPKSPKESTSLFEFVAFSKLPAGGPRLSDSGIARIKDIAERILIALYVDR
jgi:hypothetical protein